MRVMRAGSGLLCIALVASACGRLGFDELATDDGLNPDAMGSDAPLPAGRWAQVSISGASGCGVTTNGELWCWGANWSNHLGVGPESSSTVPPLRVDTRTDWAEVAVGREHQCALDREGLVWCWGLNRLGAVGTGPLDLVAPSPQHIDIGPAKTIATRDFTTCAITVTGELWCWGGNTENQVAPGTPTASEPPTRRDAATNWTAIGIGLYHVCGLQGDALMCWGDHDSGQLGLGPTSSRDTPTSVPLALGWTQIAVGAKHTCALAANGESWCWGVNWERRLGTADWDNRDTPTRTLAPALASIYAGNDHTCGLTLQNDLVCWGHAGRGRIPGHEQRELDPTIVPTSMAPAALVLGAFATCLFDDEARLWCSGGNSAGQLGTPAGEVAVMRQADARTDWTDLDGSTNHMCGRTTGGTTHCWGTGASGQLGDGAAVDRQSPVSVGTFDSVHAGSWATLALRGNEMWLWGYDIHDDTNRLVPALRNSNTLAVTQGGDHGCWIVTGNELHCTGLNEHGQLGDGTTTEATDVTIPGVWRNVWAGPSATCGTRDDGSTNPRLYCWGQAYAAGVGAQDQLVPALSNLPDLPVREVTFGDEFGCAIIGAGELWCWGRGEWGRLGIGTEDDQAIPVRVGTRDDWKTIDAGDWHVCAVATDKTLWCWGHGDQGQAGPKDVGFSLLPIQIGGAEWADVGLSYHNTCAVKLDGTRWCGGANDAGELGTGTAWTPDLVVVP